MRLDGKLVAIAAMGMLLLTGCETLKPYEKEYLLDPAMDDRATAALGSELMTSASGGRERLAAGANGGAGATSCPTCGG